MLDTQIHECFKNALLCFIKYQKHKTNATFQKLSEKKPADLEAEIYILMKEIK